MELFNDFKSYKPSQTLTDGQLRFAQVFFEGRNCLLSAGAGYGKSYVIKILFNYLDKIGKTIGKTASTGVAALNIGGTTLHSWAGVGLGQDSAENLVKEVLRNKKARERIGRTKTLFIDELSMINGEFFDKLNYIFKYIRNNSEAFGGCQIVAVGDWLQLTPIFRGGESSKFVFESEAWKEAEFAVVLLDKLMRQDEHSEFAEMLNCLRIGDTSKLDILKPRYNATFPEDGIKPVSVFCKNIDVDEFNDKKLQEIQGIEKTFLASDDGPEFVTKFFDKNCLAPKILKLKTGAQVMLLKNIDVEHGYVNGSIGVVQGFSSDGIRVKFNSGTIIVDKEEWEYKEQTVTEDGKVKFKTVGTRRQFPLRVCYGVTVHKCMGHTLERATVDLTESFAYAAHYVALSRCRTLDGLSVVPFDFEKVKVNKKCLDFYKNLKDTTLHLKRTEREKKVEFDPTDL